MPKVVIGGREYVVTESKKPTGLAITRKDNTFKFSWKKGDKNYDWGQQLYYKTNQMKKWERLSCGANVTNKSITLNMSRYIPNTEKALRYVRFKVRGQREPYTKHAGTRREKRYAPSMSDFAVKEFEIKKPNVPKVTANLSDELANRTTFSWTTSTSNESNKYFSIVQWQTVLLKNSNVTKGKVAFSQEQKSSRVSGTWEAGTGTANDSKTVTEDLTYINGTDSYTRWFRARARGPAGSSDWTYSRHVYARTNATSNTKATAIKESGGYKVTVEWTSSVKVARPINQMIVQSWVTAPGASMDVPEGSGWQDMMTVAYKDGTDKAIFYIDDVLTDDQVIFVRVNTQHDPGVPATPGTPVIAEVGSLASPTITSVTPVQETHRATIVASNVSSVPDSFLAVYYQSDEEAPMIIGIIEHGETTATVQAPDWSTAGAYAFGVQAVVGTYSEQEGPGGLTVYSLQSYEGKPLMTSGITWGAGAVPKAPENVSVTATDATGVLRVNWDWTWTEATSAEISWSQNPYAWESNEQPATYTVSNANASQWYITGLDVGVEWYVRVRLAKGSGDELLYGPYSEAIRVSLASAPSVPTLVLSDAVIPGDGTVTASWAYVSTDGTAQAYAEICTATLSQSGITYGDVIATTETAQHIDINAAEVGWTVGETYLLCLRVVSASGRTSDDWSAPVALAIAEPLTAAITETSLADYRVVSTEEDTTPYLFRPSPALEEDYDRLLLDKVVGGTLAVNQLVPIPSNSKSTTVHGVTMTDNRDGTYTFSGQAESVTYFNIAQQLNPPTNHVYALLGLVSNVGIGMCDAWGSGLPVKYTDTIFKNTSAARFDLAFYVNTSFNAGTGSYTEKPHLVDLTAFFSSTTIADYVYNLEQSTAGSGVAWLKQHYPSIFNSYQPYNAGELMSVEGLESHDTVGFNQWDEEWEVGGLENTTGRPYTASNRFRAKNFCKCLPSTTYYCSAPTQYLSVFWYDEDQNFISRIGASNHTVVSPENAKYFKIVLANATTYNNDICINLSWSGYRNGEYEEYVKHSYPLDNSLTLRGIPKLDASNNLYYDGDEYKSDGIVTRKYGVRAYQSGDESLAGAITDGTNTVYKLTTPTTETADTYDRVQVCYKGGTEEFASGNVVPVGHETKYAKAYDVPALTEMPLTVTVTGAGNTGITTVAVERAESYYLERPDERNFTGHEGETVALIQQTGEAQITIDDSALIGTLDDGAKYRIVATVSDELGQSAEATLDFEVRWTHQALIPTATIEADNNFKVMKITPVAPEGVETGDTCDIYRLSVDRPELIYPGAEFGTTYVDPYPTLGEMGGHRIVFRTANGDYITEDNTLAWTDYTAEDGDTIETMFNLIDFGGDQVAVMYDIELSSAWDKDFEETQYLGGHVTGDWNQAVSRTGSVQGSLVTTQDQDTIQALRRLADYPGICHVRTRDGSSYAADVQVNESRDMGKDVVRSEFSLAITRVDPEGYDGMTLADWQSTQEPEEETAG